MQLKYYVRLCPDYDVVRCIYLHFSSLFGLMGWFYAYNFWSNCNTQMSYYHGFWSYYIHFCPILCKWIHEFQEYQKQWFITVFVPYCRYNHLKFWIIKFSTIKVYAKFGSNKCNHFWDIQKTKILINSVTREQY